MPEFWAPKKKVLRAPSEQLVASVLFCCNSLLPVFFVRQRVIFSISGTHLFFFGFFLKVCFGRSGGGKFGRATPLGAKRHFAHTHTTDLPSVTLSAHDTTPPLPPQLHPTSSYPPHPPLAPSTPEHYTPTSHPHPPHGVWEFFVQLCSPNIPLWAWSIPA